MSEATPLAGDVAVGCHGDWRTTAIAEALFRSNRLSQYATSQPKSRFPVGLRPFIKHLRSFRWAALPLRLPWWSQQTFENEYLFSEYQRFDRSYARLLTGSERAVFAWASMARETLALARSNGARGILVLGNSHIVAQKRAYARFSGGTETIKQCWIDAQLAEYALCDAILVESNYVRNSLSECGVDARKVHVWPPHYPALSGRNPTQKLIFAVVQCGRRKGTHLVLDWWDRLKLPSSELWLLGGWSKDMRQGAPMPAGVKVFGMLRGDAYDELKRSIDVALFPTFEDGGPQSLFEAMAAGICPIASENCAAPDHIANGENGFMIPLQDHERWLATIQWCSDNRTRVRKIGLSAQQYVKSNLAPEASFVRLDSILKEVLQSNAAVKA